MLDSAFANQNNMAPVTLPFLTHIMSEGNRSQSTIKFLTGASKVRQVEIQYDQPFLEDEIETNLTGCKASSEECDYVETYTFDPTENVGKTLLVSPSDLTGTADVICSNAAINVTQFAADCAEPNPEIICSCCNLCCDDTNVTCNNFDWNVNLDPIWEYGYRRVVYSFSQNLLEPDQVTPP